jgi:hypothetical protein
VQVRSHDHQAAMGVHDLRFCFFLNLAVLLIFGQNHHGHAQQHRFASPPVLGCLDFHGDSSLRLVFYPYFKAREL